MRKNWREILPVHPAADLFPMMSEAELRELGEDIKKNGLQVPIAIFNCKHGNSFVLDGRNRLDAMEAVGLVPLCEVNKAMQWQGCPHIHVHDVDPYEFVVSANIHRRHLTTEQRLELVDKFVKANPEKSDRQIAETVKASPTTVGKRRAKREKAGDVSTVDTRQDKRGRQQPAKKRRTVEDFQKDVQEKRAAEAPGCKGCP